VLLIPLKSCVAACVCGIKVSECVCSRIGARAVSSDRLISPSLGEDTCSVARYDRSLMPGTLSGEGADHPSVTDTSVIVGNIPPLAVSVNRSPA